MAVEGAVYQMQLLVRIPTETPPDRQGKLSYRGAHRALLSSPPGVFI